MSLGFVEGPRRDFDGPFWVFFPMDGTSRKYPRLDPLSCEALISYMEPWADAGTTRRMWRLLVDDFGSDVYTVQVAAVFAVLSESLKRAGAVARFSASRDGATLWLGPRDVEPNLTIIWRPKEAHFEVLRRMP